MSYFYKTVPIFKSALWGGNNLKRLGKKTPETDVSESWELCSLPKNENLISDFDLKNEKVTDVIKKQGEEFIGNVSKALLKNCNVPFLLKFIDANDSLSIQVHPNDEYAYKNENKSLGKTEMWYVVDAKPDSYIIYGFNEKLTHDEILKNINDNNFEGLCKKVPVNKGDVIYIPAGAVHSLNKGIVVAEIQQQSDITYRLFDYNRVDTSGNKRELHIKKALDVISFENNKPLFNGLTIKKGNISVRYLAITEKFCVREIKVDNSELNLTNSDKFHAIMFISGHADFTHDGESLTAERLETVLIPAATRHYSVYGSFTALDIFVPDMNKGIFTQLLDNGYNMEDICRDVAGAEKMIDKK